MSRNQRPLRENSPFEGQPSPSSSDLDHENDGRTRRAGELSAVRLSTGRNGVTIQTERNRPLTTTNNSSRARRAPTPVARQRSRNGSFDNQLTDDSREGELVAGTNNNNNSSSNNTCLNRRRATGNTQSSFTTTRQRISQAVIGRGRRLANELTWFERMMPECILTMTAPLTGYESRLDSDVEDDEYEILERHRLKSNRRVRRRLLTLMLLAGAAGFFMYYRGRMVRKMGVKAAVSSMKHRLEDGLAKSIQETMGK